MNKSTLTKQAAKYLAKASRLDARVMAFASDKLKDAQTLRNLANRRDMYLGLRTNTLDLRASL
jgi:hypothetical protein